MEQKTVKRYVLIFCSLLLTACTNPFMVQLLEPKIITFESNGGSIVPSQNLTRGQVIQKPADPVKAGYGFNGWFMDNETFIANWDFSSVPSQDTTLYAKWDIIPAHRIELSPQGELTFDPVEIGYSEVTPQTITVTNTGNQPTGDLIITLSGNNSGSFILSADKLYNIEAGENSTFTVGPETGLLPGVYTATVTVTGENNISESIDIVIVVNYIKITTVALTVTGPAKGEIPDTVAVVVPGSFSASAVTWSPAHDVFQASTQYTASVTLTAFTNYTFTGLGGATINGQPAVIVITDDGFAVTLSYQFQATLAKDVAGISVVEQPAILSYIHGDTANISGIVVRLTYTDDSIDNVPYEEFELFSISVYINSVPLNVITLSHSIHDGQPVTVRFGSRTAYTNNLAVNQKELIITGAEHTRQYNGTAGINAGDVSVTLGGITGNDIVSATVTAAVYTSVNAGTTAMNITGVSLTGADAANYTLILPANNVPVTGGITKADGALIENFSYTSSSDDREINVTASLPGTSGQNIEYVISETDNVPETGWLNSGLFTGLAAGSTYYVFARAAENDNFMAGTAKTSTAIYIEPEKGTAGITIIFNPVNLAPQPQLNDIRIYRSNNSDSRPESVNLEITGSFTNAQWFYNDELLGSGNTLTLSASNILYNMVGLKYITLEILADGVPFSRIIPFRVEP
jgi:uncharacterized repeat protein (TIGR02543 family)